jgi:hypothetical protein
MVAEGRGETLMWVLVTHDSVHGSILRSIWAVLLVSIGLLITIKRGTHEVGRELGSQTMGLQEDKGGQIWQKYMVNTWKLQGININLKRNKSCISEFCPQTKTQSARIAMRNRKKWWISCLSLGLSSGNSQCYWTQCQQLSRKRGWRNGIKVKISDHLSIWGDDKHWRKKKMSNNLITK